MSSAPEGMQVTTAFSVSGNVEGAAAGYEVRAFDCDFRGEEPLGGSPIEGGRYRIPYRREQFSRAEKGRADLRVCVVEEGGRELVSSPIVFHAEPETEIDLVVPAESAERGLTEYERHLAGLRAVLQGVTPLEVAEGAAEQLARDLAFLTAETGIERRHLEWLLRAFELSAAVDGVHAPIEEKLQSRAVAAARDGHRPQPEVFYGWLRQGLPETWEELSAQPATTLRAALVAAVEACIVPDVVLDGLDATVARIPNPARAELHALLDSTSLPVGKTASLAARLDSVADVTDDVVVGLVDDGTLSHGEADELALAISLHRLTDGHEPLIGTVLTAELPSLPAGKLRQPHDLALLEPHGWQRILAAADVEPPEGQTRDEQARGLAMQAVGAFPDVAFRQWVTNAPEGLTEAVDRVQPLLSRGPEVLARALPEGDEPSGANGLREAHKTVLGAVRAHPGLELGEVLAAGDGPAAAADAVHERIGWVSHVLDRNPDTKFLELDYLPGSLELAQVDFGDLDEDARRMVMSNFQAHQRIHAVTRNPVASRQIMEAEIGSFSAIAAMTPTEFAESTGLPEIEALAYHDEARALANVAALNWFKAYDMIRDYTQSPVRTIPSTHDFFRPLKGFGDLLEGQQWCSCDDCQSVLSPAAYVLDLMHYVEAWILDGSFKAAKNHPLNLERRRPDLWDELELTCDATNTIVPTLDLVNEILVRYLRDVVHLTDEAAVYEHLAEQELSFHLPFVLPLEQLRVLLRFFSLTRYDVAKAMQAGPATSARAFLNLSQKEYDLVTTPRHADSGFLGTLYRIGAAANVATPDTDLGPVPFADLQHAVGLDRHDLETTLATSFVNEDGSSRADVSIVMEKDGAQVQNSREVVRNLTPRRLDRLHRLLRLQRALGWKVTELDYVLDRLKQGSVAAIDPQQGTTAGTLERIVAMLDVTTKHRVPLDELLGMVDVVPRVQLREKQPSLFDRLFNPETIAARDGRWPPQPAIRFSHPGWQRRTGGAVPGGAGASEPADNTLTRLLAGLQLSDEEFVELVAGLSGVAAIDHRAATATDDESIELSAESLDAFYRHARVRRLIDVSVKDFLRLLALADVNGSLDSTADVAKALELAEWQRQSGFTLEEISYLVGGATPTGSPDPDQVATDIVARVASEGLLEFADTIFTQVGLTEDESRATVNDPTNLAQAPAETKPLEALPNGTFRLKAGATTALTISPAVNASALAGLLREHDAVHILDVALGDTLHLSADDVAQLRELADPLDAPAQASVTRALQGSSNANDVARVRTCIAATLRFRALFKNTAFDSRALAYVTQEADLFLRPAVAGKRTITIGVVRDVASYVALAATGDAGFTTATSPADRDALEAVLSNFAGATDAHLAKVLRTDEAGIAALRPHLSALPTDPFEALHILQRALELIARLGVSGETLELMLVETPAAAAFTASSRAAGDVFGAFRAKFSSERTFREKIEPYEDELRGCKRDGLVNYITSRWPQPFSDGNKLYEYFLIDVMVEGCARTSRIAAAIASLQLYVQRVLMNLERSDDWDGTVPPKVGVVARFGDDLRRQEWQWRKHYRLWEANRKVFLYPENYLEPELRDDKTPLFRELEDELLVQSIEPATVFDAYSVYLTGFDELARLKIAGTYYDSTSHVLHLFGVTQDDAPVYYYRSVTDGWTWPEFSGWQRLTLQIPVRKVSPIVFEGRLYLFWVETATRPVNTFTNGSSNFSGYRHTVRVKYSMLRLDGEWSAPRVVLQEHRGRTADALIVEDPKLDWDLLAMQKRLADLNAELQPRTDDVTTTFTKLGDAKKAAAKALMARDQAESNFKTVDAANIAEIAGLVLIGVPPDVAAAMVSSAELLLWQTAEASYNAAEEARKVAVTAYNTALAALQKKKDEIAAQEAAIKALVVQVRWDRSGRDHRDALDSYRPEGWQWDRVYPDVYFPSLNAPAAMRLMLVPRNPPELTTGDPNVIVGAGASPILSGDFDASTGVLREMSTSETAKVMYDSRLNWHTGQVLLSSTSSVLYPGQEFFAGEFWLERTMYAGTIVGNGPLAADVQIVNGETHSMILELGGDSVWLRKLASSYSGLRLSTSLTRALAREFWRKGPASLLDPAFQLGLAEARSASSPIDGQSNPKRWNPLNASNPFLTYYRETFFHIPFLVADHLNSQQDFARAQSWYHYIFDPTAADGEVWRHRDFRRPDARATTLREQLTSVEALRAYRTNSLSPHAIARTRGTAYQKAIVMKYVDNLLDWGDSLFAQFTSESISEATMLYVMAQEILGPRPAQLGSCLNDVKPRTYRDIKGGLTDVSDFLVELESYAAVIALGKGKTNGRILIEVSPQEKPQMTQQASTAAITPGMAITPGTGESAPMVWTSNEGTPMAEMRATALTFEEGPTLGVAPNGSTPSPTGTAAPPIDYANGFRGDVAGVPGGSTISPVTELESKYGLPHLDVKHDLRERFDPGSYWHDRGKPFGDFEVDPSQVVPPKDVLFCIPPNNDLLGYWDRVEKALFKIRNCMDISGVRRLPDLFAPELDVRMLVRMKAAGLSLDDIVNATSGNVPPYRFTYILEKARQYTATVQSFGAQLLSALEKRDVEELSQLRTVHEQNLLKLATQTAQLEITAAEDTLEGLRRQRLAAEFRHAHFISLSAVGQLPPERKQQDLQRVASDFRTAAGIAQVVASLLTIIPDTGAPTAMKFGGSQLGAAGRAVAEGLNALAAFNETMAGRSGVEASNRRRDQEWRHQAEAARREMDQLDKSIDAAEIRRDIAVHALDVNDRSVKQSEEIFEFFRDKFSGAERYRLLSLELRRLYRMAFNDALTMARLTEQAFRVERPDDDTTLEGSYWDADTAGLLAGERLLMDLQHLERQYIEHNYRTPELEQHFALSQFGPEALAELRRTGECSFEVPEWFFDLSYPGHYRRRLKAARVTIPCVIGPYGNVGATLRLTGSAIRLTLPDDLDQGLGPAKSVPIRHSVSIATSRAQNDAGVFEFSFRDERFMPFEGAGAISSWQLSLPRSIRTFDYSTISDVVLHLSYTAEEDQALRDHWDGTAQALLAVLADADPSHAPPLTRVFSMRSDFPEAFQRLLNSPIGTEIDITIGDSSLPVFLGGRKATMSSAAINLVTALDDVAGFDLGIGRKVAPPNEQTYNPVGPFAAPATTPPSGELRAYDADIVETPARPGISGLVTGTYALKCAAGGPFEKAGAAGTPSTLDGKTLRDILLTVGYHVGTA